MTKDRADQPSKQSFSYGDQRLLSSPRHGQNTRHVLILDELASPRRSDRQLVLLDRENIEGKKTTFSTSTTTQKTKSKE